MWPSRYWSANYWSSRYWERGGGPPQTSGHAPKVGGKVVSYYEEPPRRSSKKKQLAKERERVAKLLGLAITDLKYEEFLENEAIETLLLS